MSVGCWMKFGDDLTGLKNAIPVSLLVHQLIAIWIAYYPMQTDNKATVVIGAAPAGVLISFAFSLMSTDKNLGDLAPGIVAVFTSCIYALPWIAVSSIRRSDSEFITPFAKAVAPWICFVSMMAVYISVVTFVLSIVLYDCPECSVDVISWLIWVPILFLSAGGMQLVYTRYYKQNRVSKASFYSIFCAMIGYLIMSRVMQVTNFDNSTVHVATVVCLFSLLVLVFCCLPMAGSSSDIYRKSFFFGTAGVGLPMLGSVILSRMNSDQDEAVQVGTVVLLVVSGVSVLWGTLSFFSVESGTFQVLTALCFIGAFIPLLIIPWYAWGFISETVALAVGLPLFCVMVLLFLGYSVKRVRDHVVSRKKKKIPYVWAPPKWLLIKCTACTTFLGFAVSIILLLYTLVYISTSQKYLVFASLFITPLTYFAYYRIATRTVPSPLPVESRKPSRCRKICSIMGRIIFPVLTVCAVAAVNLLSIVAEDVKSPLNLFIVGVVFSIVMSKVLFYAKRAAKSHAPVIFSILSSVFVWSCILPLFVVIPVCVAWGFTEGRENQSRFYNYGVGAYCVLAMLLVSGTCMAINLLFQRMEYERRAKYLCNILRKDLRKIGVGGSEVILRHIYDHYVEKGEQDCEPWLLNQIKVFWKPVENDEKDTRISMELVDIATWRKYDAKMKKKEEEERKEQERRKQLEEKEQAEIERIKAEQRQLEEAKQQEEERVEKEVQDELESQRVALEKRKELLMQKRKDKEDKQRDRQTQLLNADLVHGESAMPDHVMDDDDLALELEEAELNQEIAEVNRHMEAHKILAEITLVEPSPADPTHESSLVKADHDSSHISGHEPICTDLFHEPVDLDTLFELSPVDDIPIANGAVEFEALNGVKFLLTDDDMFQFLPGELEIENIRRLVLKVRDRVKDMLNRYSLGHIDVPFSPMEMAEIKRIERFLQCHEDENDLTLELIRNIDHTLDFIESRYLKRLYVQTQSIHVPSEPEVEPEKLIHIREVHEGRRRRGSVSTPDVNSSAQTTTSTEEIAESDQLLNRHPYDENLPIIASRHIDSCRSRFRRCFGFMMRPIFWPKRFFTYCYKELKLAFSLQSSIDSQTTDQDDNDSDLDELEGDDMQNDSIDLNAVLSRRRRSSIVVQQLDINNQKLANRLDKKNRLANRRKSVNISKPVSALNRREAPEWPVAVTYTVTSIRNGVARLDELMKKELKIRFTGSNIGALYALFNDFVTMSAVAFRSNSLWDLSENVKSFFDFTTADTHTVSIVTVDTFAFTFWSFVGLSFIYPFVAIPAIRLAKEGRLGMTKDGDNAVFPSKMFLFTQIVFTLGVTMYIPVLSTLLSALACNYSVDPWVLYRSEGIECWQGIHFAYVAAAVIGILVYYPVSTLIAPNLQFQDKGLDIKFHPSYLITLSQGKLIMAAVVAFFPTQAQAVGMLGITAIVYFIVAVVSWRMTPCLVKKVNIWIVASYSASCWAVVAAIVVTYLENSLVAYSFLGSGWTVILVTALIIHGKRYGFKFKWSRNNKVNPKYFPQEDELQLPDAEAKESNTARKIAWSQDKSFDDVIVHVQVPTISESEPLLTKKQSLVENVADSPNSIGEKID
eukprot:GILJ01008210.1.p1 GENE.GILJ01008210.1~~GILJ01008210.1.p1  ORF type:complete len:1667 (-),score=254.38 GILJ01008210.1:106-4890(-)